MLRRRNSGAESPVGELTYMLNSKKITRYLTPGHHVHLVGIGGVSMRPLGLVLKGMGMEVTGSDMNASVSTDELIGRGLHHPHRRRPQRQSGDRRRPCRGDPRV